MELRFQDPGDDEGYLLEALLDACSKATGGGAIFAWCNAGGAKALLEDETFIDFLRKGPFDLIVGIDSITDEAALKVLSETAARMPNLTARAFLHDEDALFHPKLAWFRSGDNFTVIVGSGNLTMGGLRGNWEAFSISQLRGRFAAAAETRIGTWVTSWETSLTSLDDPRVVERAKKNVGNERSLKRPRKIVKSRVALKAGTVALVAEIPRSGGRWSQANFDLDNYEKFFGAKVGTQRRIVLYHVGDNGVLGPLESRPSVEVGSRNYRFELAAARGRSYPRRGRPVGVFIRLATGEFLYKLLLPGNNHHVPVSRLLTDRWNGPSGRMRRLRIPAAELRRAWPDSPLDKAELPEL